MILPPQVFDYATYREANCVQMNDKPTDSVRPIVLILGPTAGGKTSLAIELAKRLRAGGESISADSMQVYRGMDIGTAKPTPAEQAQVPQHLLDIAEPDDDSFSVSTWLEYCHRAIDDIRSRSKWPIIVGGTNLYVKVFLYGLAELPEPNAELRAKLGDMSDVELRQWLLRIDPAAAERIHPNDRKRTIRAIEVFEESGTKLSELQTQWQAHHTSKLGEQTIIVGLRYPVEVINRRINARVKTMMEAGFLQEVQRLHEARSLGRNAREALGYKQLLEHIAGSISLEEAIERIKILTRRFAKQQRTWLRRFEMEQRWPSIWIDAHEKTAQDLAQQAFVAITNHAAGMGAKYAFEE
jgi:tRNA dimethylallyltransferase